MQAIGETVFEVVYLILVVTLGIGILRRSGGERQYRLFGWAAVLLGAGDSFHLVPRMIALWTAGLDAFSFWLGLGKLVTSVTMTVFYVLLFFVWRERYGGGKHCAGLTRLALVLAALRVLLCAMPQNRWLTNDGPLAWGILRNVPFALLGLLVILLFGRSAREKSDPYRLLWLAVTLSFAFYLPVVLFADAVPALGMLMIPKTCAYVWAVFMGVKASRTRQAAAQR